MENVCLASLLAKSRRVLIGRFLFVFVMKRNSDSRRTLRCGRCVNVDGEVEFNRERERFGSPPPVVLE